MRVLRQPGPAHLKRIDAFPGEARMLQFALQPGQTLNEALTAPLVAAGFQSAAITFRGAGLEPFRYVRPAPSPDASHVAWFSATYAPDGACRIEQANATFGWAAGAPSVHCHAVWREPDGSRRGGHILPYETYVAEPAEASAWGFTSIRMDVLPDIETNFSLFQPLGPLSPAGANAIVARVRPNEDIIMSIETVSRLHNVAEATIRGGLGSLVTPHFTSGCRVRHDATEVLVREGFVRSGHASLDMLVVDMDGIVHEGWLARGDNPVCITFDLVLEAV